MIEQSFGHKTFYLYAVDASGEIQGILPLVYLSSRFFGKFMISMPYFNYGGICADSDEVRRGLLEAAVSIAQERHAAHIELRHVQPFAGELAVKMSKVSMELALPDDHEILWKSLPSKMRSQIRRPLKEGMFATQGRVDELDAFYDVFSANMRDLGTPVYSKQFFWNILKEFPTTTWIHVIRTKEGVPVAASFMVAFMKRIEIPWASSLRSYNYLSPNMLLYWNALQDACNRKFTLFDFGRSTLGEGTYRFKAQWGAQPRQLYWHYWLPDGGALPELNPHNPRYRLAIHLWKKLPLSLTKLIGPQIVKGLP